MIRHVFLLTFVLLVLVALLQVKTLTTLHQQTSALDIQLKETLWLTTWLNNSSQLYDGDGTEGADVEEAADMVNSNNSNHDSDNIRSSNKLDNHLSRDKEHSTSAPPSSVDPFLAVVNITHRPFRPELSFVLQQIDFSYPSFENNTEPLFWEPQHAHEFRTIRVHTNWWDVPEARRGSVVVLANATYRQQDECGLFSNYTLHYPKVKSNEGNATNITTRRAGPLDSSRLSRKSLSYKKLVILDDRPAASFQHFMDSGMPKLLQAKDYLDENPDAVLMAHFGYLGAGHIIHQIIRALGIVNPIEKWQSNTASAEQLVLICQAPNVHPSLWQRAQYLLQVSPQNFDNKIVWVKRTAQNSRGGRFAINNDQVVDYLQRRFGGDRVVEFDSSRFSLNATGQLFGSAQVVLGIHGGGLYNLLFSSPGTTLMEIMPTAPRTGQSLGAADKIFWTICNMLRQPYWRLHQTVAPSCGPQHKSGRDCLQVNLTQIHHVLDRIVGANDTRLTPSETVALDNWSAPNATLEQVRREGVKSGPGPNTNILRLPRNVSKAPRPRGEPPLPRNATLRLSSPRRGM